MFVVRTFYEIVADLKYEPWRIPDACIPWTWTEDTCNTIMDRVAETIPLNVLPDEKLNLLVIGPKSHGKSSFINAVASLSMQERTTYCNAGGQGDGDNVTTVYRQFDFLGRFTGFRMCDVRGLTKVDGASDNLIADLKMLIRGHIKPGYKFDVLKPIDPENDYYIEQPSAGDRIHGIIIVFDITEAYEVHAAHIDDLKVIRKTIHEMNVPISVVLTKVDKHCHRVEKNIEYIYHSKKVFQAINKIHTALSVPKRNIHPIVNFEDEIAFRWKEKIPVLVAISESVRMARHHLYNEEKDKRVEVKQQNLQTK